MFARRVGYQINSAVRFGATRTVLFKSMRRAASSGRRPVLRNEGYVSQVVGTIHVDVDFPGGAPPLQTVIDVVADGKGKRVSLKLVELLNANTGRCVATTKFLKHKTKCVVVGASIAACSTSAPPPSNRVSATPGTILSTSSHTPTADVAATGPMPQPPGPVVPGSVVKIRDNSVLSDLKFGPHVVDINFKRLTDAGFESILRQCPNVEVIKATVYRHYSEESWKAIAACCPKLRHLEIWSVTVKSATDADISLIAASCPHLQHLAVSGDHRISDAGIAAVATNCPELQYLNVSRCDISDVGLSALAANCRQLRHLNVGDSNNGKVTDIGVTKIAKGCPQLQHLNLTSCDIGDVGIRAIAESCPHLEYLEMSFRNKRFTGGSVSDTGITAIGTHCLQLKHLDLGSTSGTFTDVGLTVLATNCLQLKHLDICYAGGKITSATFEAMAANSRNLEYLDLRRCANDSNLSYHADLALLAKCPKLRRVVVDYLQVGLAELKEACPQCRVGPELVEM